MLTNKSVFLKHLLILCLSTFFFACANRGSGPAGGPKDTTPPRPVKSSPKNGQTNYTKNKIDIDFDEIILLDGQDKITVSPTQKKAPSVSALGKTVRVILNDSLLPNTTYSIDFGDAIIDNNERNKLTGYSFAFTTGASFDTLQIAGTLIDAFNQNPISNAIVGVYANLSNEAFIKEKLLRICKTNEQGHFTIRNIKAGEYRIVALNDLNGDLQYNLNESLAFGNKTIIPSSHTAQRTDTLKQKGNPDSLIVKNYTAFDPSDIILRSYKQDIEKQYLVKAERTTEKFTLIFNLPNKNIPTIEPLNFDLKGNYLLEKNATKDTLSYWLTDTRLLAKDSLIFKLNYLKSDSLGQLIPATDTVRLKLRKQDALGEKQKNNKKNTAQIPKHDFLKIETSVKGKLELNSAFIIHTESPIKQINEKAFSLYEKVDTLWKKAPISLQKIDSIGRSFQVNNNWLPDTEYKLEIDSAAIQTIYGKISNKSSMPFKTKALEEYATFTILLQNIPTNSLLQIINKEEKLVKEQKVTGESLIFSYMNPGDYYLRLIVDENNNGKYDAGNYSKNLQPEPVYYFPKRIALMGNWEVEENWNITEIPLIEQKPRELIKINKK